MSFEHVSTVQKFLGVVLEKVDLVFLFLQNFLLNGEGFVLLFIYFAGGWRGVLFFIHCFEVGAF